MKKIILLFVVVLSVLFLTAESCNGANWDRHNEIYRLPVETREKIGQQAFALYPIPKVENFPLRKDLVEYTLRQDLINHQFYVYILGDNGNIIGYYVARSAPQNACNFLSETIADSYGRHAPSLDGIYYGGTGASGSCDEFFFFDAATNALIKVRGLKFFTTDQPLRVEAEPIQIKIGE